LRNLPLYIDVSEIYRLGLNAREMTGVQRVVLEISYELCRTGRAIPIINDQARQTLFTLDPSVFSEELLYNGKARVEVLGRPQKFRDPERFAPGTLARTQVVFQNRLRSLLHRIKHKSSAAITGRADNANHAVLCLGHPSTARKTLETAKRSGGFARAVVLIHDVIRVLSENGEDSSRMAQAERRSIEICDDIGVAWVANSKFTRSEIARMSEIGRLPELKNPVEVILLAHEMRRDPKAPLVRNPSSDEPYFLTVGGLDGRKNGQVLIEAMARIGDEDGPEAVPLILAVGRKQKHELLNEFKSSDRYASIKDRIRWVGNSSHAALHDLYSAAAATIYPSKYEGFGLPVGESLWCGTPAVASTATSIPEVGVDLAHYFDCDDAAALARLLLQFSDTEFSETQRTLIQQRRGELRSWAEVAENYAEFACI